MPKPPRYQPPRRNPAPASQPAPAAVDPFAELDTRKELMTVDEVAAYLGYKSRDAVLALPDLTRIAVTPQHVVYAGPVLADYLRQRSSVQGPGVRAGQQQAAFETWAGLFEEAAWVGPTALARLLNVPTGVVTRLRERAILPSDTEARTAWHASTVVAFVGERREIQTGDGA
jgi:hypothetical protein